ncbi:MAG: ATPase, T2SS/T4P/T4SS family [Nocardioidaceae bacterium]
MRATLQDEISATDTPLTMNDRVRIAQEVADDILGYGWIEPFLRDVDVTEVMVNGPFDIWIEKSGRIQRVNGRFNDEAHLRRTIEKIVAKVGRRIDESSAMCDARLADGSRVNAVVPPRRMKKFNGALAQTLQIIAGALQAGLSLPQAIDTFVQEGDEAVAGEFRRAIIEQRLGVDIEDSLDSVADRMDSEDFKWVVMAVRIQREVGGNLAELLLTVAATLREREYLRRQVQVLSAEGKMSAYILGGLPPAFFLYLSVARPTYLHPMLHTSLGMLMLGVAAVMMTVGGFWMKQTVKVEV